MKTKLYHRFVKRVCSDFKISKKQLFSRQFKSCVIVPYKYTLSTRKLVRDESKLMVLDTQHPLSTIWECYDLHTKWFIKYWKYNHWKPYIQMKLDLGFKLEEILEEVISKRKSK